MPRLLAVLALTLASLAALAQGPANFVSWRDGLHSAAQPSAAWLGVMKGNYEAMVNLAPPQSHGSLRDEGGIVGAQGLVYVNIPVDFGRPTAEDFRVFVEVMKALRGRRVFVHCQVNLRASAFVFLYRVLYEGAAVGETAMLMNRVWAPDKVWRAFIEDTLAAHGRKGEVF